MDEILWWKIFLAYHHSACVTVSLYKILQIFKIYIYFSTKKLGNLLNAIKWGNKIDNLVS